MDRRLALLVLWVAFAVAAVGVGFGAAGLVGDPFADGVTDAAPASDVPSGPSRPPSGSPSQPPNGSPSQTPNGSPSRAEPSGGRPSSASPSRASPSSSPSGAIPSSSRPSSGRPSGTPKPTSPGDTGGPVTRSITTRGGLASATCSSGSVRLSASPAVGWQIKDIDPGPDHEVRVRFEPSDDGDGRVEVEAACSGGAPRFTLDDESGEDGD